MRPATHWFEVTVASVLIASLPASARAAGFALIEQSVSAMGTAYAGTAVLAEDASTVYFNPAGMTRLPGTRLAGAAHVVIPSSRFDADPGAGGSGGDGGDAGETGVVPNLFATHQLNDRLFIGVAVNVPFGLATDYNDGWVGRYHALRSEVLSVNLNPAIAFKLNDVVSLGAGISYQYIDAELSNAVDFGLIAARTANPGGALDSFAGSADGTAVVSGDDRSWGFNLGVLLTPTDSTRIGIHYRSAIEHTVEGSADFSVATLSPAFIATVDGIAGVGTGAAIQAGLNANFTDTGVSSEVELPSTLTISLAHDLTPEWTLAVDFSRTGWSSMPELRFEFDSGLPDSFSIYDWKDSNRYAIGARFSPSQHPWVLRFGVALDETPLDSRQHRTPRLPDADRTWVSVGGSYALSKQMTIDFAYAHLFFDDTRIEKDGTTADDLLRGPLNGSYDASVDIISAQLTYRLN